MGWSEKTGIGRTNKRIAQQVEVEIRPKGMGLGLGGKKPKSGNSENIEKSDNEYKKGTYIKIINGKYKHEIGKIISFDDGLNRLNIKLDSTDEIVNTVQNFTRLLNKEEIEKLKRNK